MWSLLSQDKTLYHSLSRWAQAANWQLMWEAERDFPINAQISVEGSFTVAIHQPNCRFNADKNAPHFCRLTWALGRTRKL